MAAKDDISFFRSFLFLRVYFFKVAENLNQLPNEIV